MKRVAVFCGSSVGFDPGYEQVAAAVGRALALRGIGIVYGGAKVGLMGAVAAGALQEGGEVVGVLPHFLMHKEIAHEELTELILVDSMHERKKLMNDLCDGVIALPGGFGTLEELFEVLTWGQLGLHRKPMGILNIDGFYDALRELAQTMVDRGFLKDVYQNMLLISDDIEDLLRQMDAYVAPAVGKWVTRDTV